MRRDLCEPLFPESPQSTCQTDRQRIEYGRNTVGLLGRLIRQTAPMATASWAGKHSETIRHTGLGLLAVDGACPRLPLPEQRRWQGPDLRAHRRRSTANRFYLRKIKPDSQSTRSARPCY